MAYLFSHDGADAGKTLIQRLSNRQRLSAYFFGKCILTDGQRILFLCGHRNKIGSSGKNFADRTYLQGNMFDAVDDFILVVGENDVAVFAHQFHDQIFAAEIPHLIQMLDFDADDALEAGLLH